MVGPSLLHAPISQTQQRCAGWPVVFLDQLRERQVSTRLSLPRWPSSAADVRRRGFGVVGDSRNSRAARTRIFLGMFDAIFPGLLPSVSSRARRSCRMGDVSERGEGATSTTIRSPSNGWVPPTLALPLVRTLRRLHIYGGRRHVFVPTELVMTVFEKFLSARFPGSRDPPRPHRRNINDPDLIGSSDRAAQRARASTVINGCSFSIDSYSLAAPSDLSVEIDQSGIRRRARAGGRTSPLPSRQRPAPTPHRPRHRCRRRARPPRIRPAQSSPSPSP